MDNDIQNSVAEIPKNGSTLVVTENDPTEGGFPPTYDLSIIGSDGNPIFNAARRTMNSLLHDMEINKVLSASNFSKDDLELQLSKAMTIKHDFVVNDRVDVEAEINAGENPGIYVGVNIKF